MHNLRNELMHYTNDLSDGADLKAEAVACIERIAQYMTKEALLHHSRPLALAYLALTEEVDSVPVVHGRWDIMEGTKTRRICSKCGWDVPEYGKFYSYCPNCGAKMDGGESDEGD